MKNHRYHILQMIRQGVLTEEEGLRQLELLEGRRCTPAGELSVGVFDRGSRGSSGRQG